MTAFVPAPPFTRRHRAPPRRRAPRACLRPLVVGLNVYSHDVSAAVVDASGALLHASSKERLTRRKHDAGDASILVHHALTAVAPDDASAEQVANDVALVVANNHHCRVLPYEARLPLLVALRYAPPSALSPWNLLGSPHVKQCLAPNARKIELGHHLAHAFAAFAAAPFDQALVLVMDGMGDAKREWRGGGVFCDWDLPKDTGFVEWHGDREAESAYVFDKGNVRRVWKRWTREREPPELPNHSFEDMESVGAVYSRVSAILFADWNNCGKVMGLAPYAKQRLKHRNARYFMQGDLYDGTFDVEEGLRKGLDHVGQNWHTAAHDSSVRQYLEDLAYHVQCDLEEVVLDLLKRLKEQTGQKNLVFCGGVALNSTLNGIIVKSGIFDKVSVPPFPGDDGVAIGCASFGHWYLQKAQNKSWLLSLSSSAPLPFLGTHYSQEDIAAAVKRFEPWIQCNVTDEAKATAQALEQSKIVAWFQGRSEFGPRALGNRSILADPRHRETVDHVNKVVKKRESFRPFAPSVLADHAHEWFHGCTADSSPFMSMTLPAKRALEIQAVVHVDGTSRLQTLRREQNPRYYDMICVFKELTGVPMVLNTSFNVAGEPIVESPDDAIRTFLDADGIHMLAFPGLIIQKAELSFDFVNDDIFCSACPGFRSHQIQDSYGSSMRTEVTYVMQSSSDLNDDHLERIVTLIDALELEILELIHNEGECSTATICEYLIGGPDDTSPVEMEAPSSADIQDRLAHLYKNRLIFRL